MTAERVIRWSTASAVLGVAAVAAVASYEHAYDLVRMHGETGWTARMVPLTVDGLIYASSMVMLDSARRRRRFRRWLGGCSAWDRGDARGQRHPWPGPWPDRRGGGRVACGRAGRIIRAPHDGRPQFSGVRRRRTREPGMTRTRCRNRRSRYSPNNLQQTGFRRSRHPRSLHVGQPRAQRLRNYLRAGDCKPGRELVA